MPQTPTRILVDADACPVKAEVVRVAERHGLTVVLVSNTWMRGPDHPLVQRILVPSGPDAADARIAAEATAADIVITSDIPLAALCLDAGARVLRPNGTPLDRNAIGMALAMRDLTAHLRETGEIAGGPAAFAPRDRTRFLDALEAAVQALKRARR